jgi:hypothetical protein
MAVIEVKGSDLKVGDKVYDVHPTHKAATYFMVVEVIGKRILKMEYISGPTGSYIPEENNLYLFDKFCTNTWWKVLESLSPDNYALWIKLRAEVIKHFHDTHNIDKFTGQGYNMLYALKVAESELKNCITDQDFIISLDEMLLNSLDECVELVISRQNEHIKRIINQF